MKKQPLVSILLSIYKVEEYLEECLDSILAQSYKNLEIVCVDNGSPDKCGEILKKYAQKDKRIKVVTLKENKMLCGGRNAGLDNATGDFICFVDPDDWIEKDHIKSMVDAIQTQKDPEGRPYNLVLNYNAINYMQDSQDSDRKIIFANPNKAGHYSIKDYNERPSDLETSVPMWGRLYRKSFLDEHKEIRFLEGFHTDNIPYTTKLLAHMKYWYAISSESYPNSAYWRRLITLDGAITPVVLFQNMEIPACLENLYDYLKKHGLERKVRVMFHLFFVLCFPRHKDMPRYYQRFKELMIKMEDDIKNAPEDVYPQSDRDLCNLLIYTNNFFQFTELYFRPAPCVSVNNVKNVKNVKLFFIFPVYKRVERVGRRIDYYILGLPFLRVRFSGEKKYFRFLFFIPLLKTQVRRK